MNANPFHPFTVSLKDGAEFIVDDPEAVAISNGGAAFIALDTVHFFNCETTSTMRSLSEVARS